MPDPALPSVDTDPAIAEWTALLDRFEHDAARAVDAGAVDPTWHPASTPLPAALAERARHVLALQRAAISAHARERDEVRAQLTAVRRVPAEAHGAAYVDLDG